MPACIATSQDATKIGRAEARGRLRVAVVADPIFDDPRLAEIYDPLDPDRSDLDVYAAIPEEFGARTGLGIGCRPGTFACLLAKDGIDVVGLDPAEASLEVARAKRGAERVRWVCA